jgi:hypothetical protein
VSPMLDGRTGRAACDGEKLRAWTSWIHLAVGLALPLLLILHIWLGKRTRPAAQLQKRPGSLAKLT